VLVTTAEKARKKHLPGWQEQTLFAAATRSTGGPNRRSFSTGVVTAGVDRGATLEDLVAKADALMYRQKQKKKGLPEPRITFCRRWVDPVSSRFAGGGDQRQPGVRAASRRRVVRDRGVKW